MVAVQPWGRVANKCVLAINFRAIDLRPGDTRPVNGGTLRADAALLLGRCARFGVWFNVGVDASVLILLSYPLIRSIRF